MGWAVLFHAAPAAKVHVRAHGSSVACQPRSQLLLLSQEDVLGVAEDCSGDAARRDPSGRRLARTLQALLGVSSQMQDSMGAERPHRHKQAVAAAIGRLAAVAAGRHS